MEHKWEWVPIDDIIPCENNARKHTEESIQTVANSIKKFGWKNAIKIDEENVILAGHGRRLAALKLGLKEVPVERFNDLSEEEKKAFRLADNKTAENSVWDFPALEMELDDIIDIDMADFGFLAKLQEELEEDTNPYTQTVNIPQYEPSGEGAEIGLLVDTEKSEELIQEINESNVSEKEKAFLRLGAYRHNIFDYKAIAEYYATAGEEMQRLMEKSALVIIDFDDAIAEGYARYRESVKNIMFGDDE